MSIVGPFNKTIDIKDFQKSMTWYRTVPVNRSKALPYSVDIMYLLPDNTLEGYDAKSWSVTPINHPYLDDALAKARERLKSSLGDNSGLGTTLIEWKQSLNMITTRAVQLTKFVAALKRGHFDTAYSAIRGRVPKKPPRGLHKGKGFANNFLEWHFGWSPLIKDIHESVKVLEGPIPAHKVRGRATVRHTFRNTYFYSPPQVVWYADYEYVLKVEVGGLFHVTNPNLRLATQLGLTNPASLAWEVTPFSFVVDWFVPVGNFLSQWTDFLGLDVQEPYTTRSAELYLRELYAADYGPGNSRTDKMQKYRRNIVRNTGIANFALHANRFTGFSATRGATAIALLIQQLRS